MAKSAVKFELTATDKTERAFKSAMANATNLEKKLMSIMAPVTALASVTGFGMLITKTAEAGDVFDDMSARTGVAVEELSALSYIAQLTGTDIDAVEKSAKYLTNQMLDLERGTGSAKKTFEALGISVTDRNGDLRSFTDVLTDAAGKIAAMDDETRQAAYAMELFGARSGASLVPMLKLGKDGIAAMIAESKRLGITWSTEDAAAAGLFNDRLTDMKGAVGGLGRALVIELLPALTDTATATANWVAEHKEVLKLEIADKITTIKEDIGTIAKYKDVIGGAIGVGYLATHTAMLLKFSTALYGVTAGLEYLKNSEGKKPLSTAFGERTDYDGFGGWSNRIRGKSHTIFGGGGMSGETGAGGGYDDIFNMRPVSILMDRLPEAKKTLDDAEAAATQYQNIKNVFTSAWNMPKSYMSLQFTTADIATPQLPTFLDASVKDAMIAYDNEILDLRRANTESWIRLTKDGYDEQKALLELYYEDEFGQMTDSDERKKIARMTLNNEIEAMDREHLAVMQRDNVSALMQFGSTWGNYMFSMAEQSGNVFDNIADGFSRMLQRMTVEAAAAGVFNLLTGGVAGGFSGGFMTYLKGAFGFRAGGGDVGAGKPYFVGERGIELFVPRTAGTVVPNAALKTAAQTVTNKTRIQVIIQTNRDVSTMDAYRFAELSEQAHNLGLWDSMREIDGDA